MLEYSKDDALYRGAARACLAAFHGRSSLWAVAEADLDRAEANAAGLKLCTDRAMLALLRRLVGLHRQYPDASLVRGPVNHTYLHCPRLFGSVETNPAHGPASGGYTVTARGEYLPATVVIVDAIYHRYIARGRSNANGTETRFVIPPARPDQLTDESNTLYLQTENWTDGWALFAYDLPAEPVGPSSESPTPEPGSASTGTSSPSS